MLATYLVVDYATRQTLGNAPGSNYAPSVLADWVGLLTGSITSVSQLSAYADKVNAVIQGSVGNWTIYDADAHPGYPGVGRVLRRLNSDGITYQYLFFALRVHATDYLSGVFGVMGGWDTTTKSPTTPMMISTSNGSATVIGAGVPVSAANLALTSVTGANGNAGTTVFTPANGSSLSVPYKILNTPSLLAIWPDASAGATCFPMCFIAEYQPLHPWNTPASGVSPIVYGTGNTSSDVKCLAAHIRNTIGNVVPADYCGLSSAAGNVTDSTSAHGGFPDPSNKIFDYTRNAAGVKAVPVLPIDVNLRANVNGYYCYAGRLKELFATLPALQVGDTFQLGADTYIVIPTGSYNNNLASYSLQGKLCAKVQ